MNFLTKQQNEGIGIDYSTPFGSRYEEIEQNAIHLCNELFAHGIDVNDLPNVEEGQSGICDVFAAQSDIFMSFTLDQKTKGFTVMIDSTPDGKVTKSEIRYNKRLPYPEVITYMFALKCLAPHLIFHGMEIRSIINLFKDVEERFTETDLSQ